MRQTLLLASMLGLAGCLEVAVDAPAFDNALRYAAADTLDALLIEMTPTADMPSTGNASYQGYLDLALAPAGQDRMGVLMDANLTADFGSATLTGNFDKPIRQDGRAISGAAVLSGGTITGTSAAGQIEGMVAVPGASYMLDGALDGTFLGGAAMGLGGDVTGTLRETGGPAGGVSGRLITRR